MGRHKSLIFGVGINDADYAVKKIVSGKQVKCEFYRRWQGMLQRCYSVKSNESFPSYVGCQVSDDWLVFSNFKSWMQQQKWNGMHLDKDILVLGNRVYSPETCVFVDPAVNAFVTDRANCRGEFPIGVSFDKVRGKLKAYCRNPFTSKLETIGYFSDASEAHNAWKLRKRYIAYKLAEAQHDERVANALRLRYA